MNFETYTNRLVSLTNFDAFEKPLADYKEVLWLTVFQDKVQKKEKKKKRSQKLNFRSLTIKDFTFLMESPPCPCLILI